METKSTDPIDKLERITRTLRDALLLIAGIAVVVYFFPAIKGLRARIRPENIQEIGLPFLSVKLAQAIDTFGLPSFPIEAVGGGESNVEKGTAAFLAQKSLELREAKNPRIDVLLIVPNKRYTGRLLLDYVSRLNIRYVAFQAGTLEGWIDSGSFSGQIVEREQNYRYEDLKARIAGIHTDDKVARGTSVKEVLEELQHRHLDSIAVVDEIGKLDFMASRVDILSKVVASAILEERK